MTETNVEFQGLVHRRAKYGILVKFLNKTMPPDPKPDFVWPRLVVEIGQKHLSIGKLAIVAVSFILSTISIVYLLLKVPFFDQSVVKLLTSGFELIIPKGWATVAAWTVGILGTLLLGGITSQSKAQNKLQSQPATKYKVYNFIVELALFEEQFFRSGCEKWTWVQRIRACLIFGIIHITNIWYSIAAGVALGLTGFGFLVVYLWYYKKTKDQVVATAASTTVHAIYNIILLVVLVVALSALFFYKF